MKKSIQSLDGVYRAYLRDPKTGFKLGRLVALMIMSFNKLTDFAISVVLEAALAGNLDSRAKKGGSHL